MNKAEKYAEQFNTTLDVAAFQKVLASEAETYTQCECTYSDGSILEFYVDDDQALAVRTFANREEFEAAEPNRPERPCKRVGLKKAGGGCHDKT